MIVKLNQFIKLIIFDDLVLNTVETQFGEPQEALEKTTKFSLFQLSKWRKLVQTIQKQFSNKLSCSQLEWKLSEFYNVLFQLFSS